MKALPNTKQLLGERVQGHYITNAFQRFCGQEMSKTWGELFQLEAFFSRYHFDTLVELGTGTGTTTIFLALQAYFKKAKIYTFDTKSIPSPTIELLEALGVLYYTADIFSEETSRQIIERLQRRGNTLAYFDNGNKIKEMEMFAKHLKKDDLILVHDFQEEFKEEDVLRWCGDYGLDRIEKDWFASFVSTHIGFMKR